MFCPNCRTEYMPGIKVCADCGAELVEELPEEEKPEKETEAEIFLTEEELAEFATSKRYRPAESLDYTSAEFKAKDNLSGAITFCVFGAVGLIAVPVCYVMKLPFFNMPLTAAVGVVLFAAMLTYGIVALRKTGSLKEAAEAENALITSVKAWQKETLTPDFLNAAAAEAESIEEQDLLRADFIREKTLEAFPALKPDLLEFLTDSFLSDGEEN